MKKRLIYTVLAYLGLMSGSITLGATVDMQIEHYVAMILLMLGGYAMAVSHERK